MLHSQLFSQNTRLNQAATNSPPMRRGENDTAAVALVQQALRDLEISTMRRSIRPNGTFDGDFSGETFEAVRKFQEDNSMANSRGFGDGIVGANTLEALDDLAAARGLVPVVASAPSVVTPSVETPSTLPVGIPRIPSAAKLRQEYNRFVSCGGKPCQNSNSNGRIRNQCAIRLSIALGRANIGFHMRAAAGVRLIVHGANNRHCGGHIEVPHDARAQRLFDHLSSFWRFTTYRINRRLSGEDVYNTVFRTPGIVFFDDLRGGRASSSAGGDHIDFFDGKRIMNDELNYAAPGEPRGRNANTTFVATKSAIHFLRINP
ncbi:peptidoglycan-binding domain-containing protein [uncultured Paraglaciecola sp.]|uniref:peptidoglycan-binding domain-containing protein n=1 Tax=uncultured Paraglaciecola sp. TaxID=1765024 RepID=UPI0030D90884|tara:strand:- start:42835 stop:43788 length:954 start_codon:yes stop_codon:yes gene_type:complete